MQTPGLMGLNFIAISLDNLWKENASCNMLQFKGSIL